MSDTPLTDRASQLCHPWTLPTDHEALSKFRLLANEMAKLERENEALRKDAERYRWLKSKAIKSSAYDRYTGYHWQCNFYDPKMVGFDKTIDTAIEEQS